MAATKNTSSFLKSMLLYGLILGGLLIALKLLEFNLVIKNNVFEVYAGIVAVLFCVVGIWVGLKLTNKSKKLVVEVQGGEDWKMDESILQELGISKREYDVLELIAKGHTNQEVADKLFVSPNTVKTHLANLFAKLDVNRRTQAIQRAKELNLIP
jgi:DNA-binding CsgD family transcriptional regulator